MTARPLVLTKPAPARPRIVRPDSSRTRDEFAAWERQNAREADPHYDPQPVARILDEAGDLISDERDLRGGLKR